MNQTPMKSVSVLVIEDEDFAASFVRRVLDRLSVGNVIDAVNGFIVKPREIERHMRRALEL